jgi:hypothetical protein
LIIKTMVTVFTVYVLITKIPWITIKGNLVKKHGPYLIIKMSTFGI